MPKSKFDSFPVSSFDEFKDRFPLVLEYFRNDFNSTYGLGTDTKGSLDFTDNLADPASFSGTTSNTFTLDTDDTGGDVSLIFGTTNNEFLSWIDDDSRFLLSDDLELTGDLLPTTDDTYNIGSTDLSWQNMYLTGSLLFDDTNEFTHDGTDFTLNDSLDITGEFTVSGIINANGGITSDDLTDTAWGIQNQNLLDKTANETITGDWIHDGSLSLSTITSGSVLFAGTDGLISEDNSNFFWDDTNNYLGIGTIPSSPLHIKESLDSFEYQLGINVNMNMASNVASGLTFGINRYGGTLTAKQDISDGTTVGQFDFFARTNGSVTLQGRMACQVITEATDVSRFFISSSDFLDLLVTDSIRIPTDNVPVTWGATNTGSISHDGINMNINPDLVGSGRLLINNRDVKSMALMVR